MKSYLPGILALTISLTFGFGQTTWLDREPFIDEGPLSQTLFSNGRFVFHDLNRVFTTSDGKTWSRNASARIPNGCYDNGIFYLNNQYFALGHKGFATSKDLVAWDSTIMNKYYLFRSIAYGNGTYVLYANAGDINAGGNTRVLISSSDGRNWKSDTVLFDVKSIVFANNQFVAVGTKILTSPDGITWTTQQFIPEHALNYVTFVNGNYLAVGDSGIVIMSKDGVGWDYRNLPPKYSLTSAAYGNNKYVVGGFGSALLSSDDGISWNIINYDSSYDYGRYFVAFGNGQFLATGIHAPVRTSSDGVAWQVTNFPGSFATWEYKSITYSHDMFIALGTGNYLATSPDADEWTIFPSQSFSSDMVSSVYSSAAYGAGKYVIVGDTSLISLNGKEWTKIPSGKTGTVKGTFVTFQQGKFLALDGKDLWTSQDGLDWSVTASKTPGLNSMAYGSDKFIAVGERDSDSSMKIFSSTDAVTWTPIVIDTGKALRRLTSVAYGNKMFVAVGGTPVNSYGDSVSGYLLYSRDGDSWSRVPLKISYRMNSVAYGGSHFIAVGDSGSIFSSVDGITWTQRRKIENKESMVSVTHGNNRFVIVGTLYYLSQTFRTTYVGFENDSMTIVKPAIDAYNNQVEVVLSSKLITVGIPRALRSRQARVSLFTVGGKRLFSQQASTWNRDRFMIQTSGLMRGIYILSVSGLMGANRFSKKVEIIR